MHRRKVRFLYMILIGVVISLLLHFILPPNENRGIKPEDFLISILITILVWEGNLILDQWINKKYPWGKAPLLRLLVQFPISVVYSALVIRLSLVAYNQYVCDFPDDQKEKFMSVSIVVGVLVSIILLSWEISSQFFSNWRRSLIEIEKYKSESLQAQLQNLKNQLNPHFLFNNLSVLSSLVYKDQNKAVDFINQLSKVYRYLLDNRNSELVTLETELKFMESYNYLLKIRFDKSLIFKIEIPPDNYSLSIPPMALQMLVENSIKHNEVSLELPLTIHIFIKGDKLVVNNNFQLRSNKEPGSKTGLQNIRDRYKYFTDEEVEVIQNEKEFTVLIPLIKQQ